MKKLSIAILKTLFLICIIGVYLCTQIVVGTIYTVIHVFIILFKGNALATLNTEDLTQELLQAVLGNMNLIFIISGVISIVLLFIIARARYETEYKSIQSNLLTTETTYGLLNEENKSYSSLNRMILDKFRFKRISIKEIPLLVIMGVSMQFITIALLEVLYKTNKLNNAFEKHEELMKGFDGGNIFLVTIAVAVLAPIIEEVICRGFFRVEMRGINILLYVFVSSLAFGLMHMNLLQAIYAFPLGILLAIAYIFIDSIWAPIILHSAVNFTSVILSKLQQYINITETALMVIQAVSFVIVILAFVYYYKRYKENTYTNQALL